MTPPALLMIASGAVATVGAWETLRRTAPGRHPRWQRSNFRGRPVSLLGGPVVVVVALIGTAIAALAVAESGRTAAACAVVVAIAGAAGLYDDLRGDPSVKGLAGHLRAARGGRLTSGLIKVVALVCCATLAAVILGDGGVGQQLADAALIAASANLVNLFDLRPGRAAKSVALALTLCLAVRSFAPIAWCLGVVLGVLPYDLRERVMLGDGGANAIGGVLGVALVVVSPGPARWAALAVVSALTIASEAISFSRVIDATPPLRWLDELGRGTAEERVLS